MHQERCGVRPSDRSRCSLRVWSISCIGKILIYFVPGRPVNSSPFHPSSGCHMATHFMLAHKAVPHGCRHLLFTTMCSTIPTSPAMTPVSPHGAAGEQKQPPSPHPTPRLSVPAFPYAILHLCFVKWDCSARHGCPKISPFHRIVHYRVWSNNLFESWCSGELPQRGVKGEPGGSEQS